MPVFRKKKIVLNFPKPTSKHPKHRACNFFTQFTARSKTIRYTTINKQQYGVISNKLHVLYIHHQQTHQFKGKWHL